MGAVRFIARPVIERIGCLSGRDQARSSGSSLRERTNATGARFQHAGLTARRRCVVADWRPRVGAGNADDEPRSPRVPARRTARGRVDAPALLTVGHDLTRHKPSLPGSVHQGTRHRSRPDTDALSVVGPTGTESEATDGQAGCGTCTDEAEARPRYAPGPSQRCRTLSRPRMTRSCPLISMSRRTRPVRRGAAPSILGTKWLNWGVQDWFNLLLRSPPWSVAAKVGKYLHKLSAIGTLARQCVRGQTGAARLCGEALSPVPDGHDRLV